MKKDTLKELLLICNSGRDLIDKIVNELILCYDNQFRKTKLYTDEEVFFLHKILLSELKEEKQEKKK
jgi:hypothetical protein